MMPLHMLRLVQLSMFCQFLIYFIRTYNSPINKKKNNTLPFLDVLFIRDNEKFNTTVYRNDTYNDLYLQWNFFTPISWKRGILKSLISRVYMVCSNETLLEKEHKHLKHVFHKINGCPWWVIDQASTSIRENINKSKGSAYYPDTSEQPVEKIRSLIYHMLDLKVTLLSKLKTFSNR